MATNTLLCDHLVFRQWNMADLQGHFKYDAWESLPAILAGAEIIFLRAYAICIHFCMNKATSWMTSYHGEFPKHEMKI